MRKLIPALLLLLIASPAYARYVDVSWDAVAGATSYKLYWGPISSSDVAFVSWEFSLSVGNVTTYYLAINEETTYLVVTANDGVEGPASSEIVFLSTSAISTTISSGVNFSAGVSR